jgi:hypothetical protein
MQMLDTADHRRRDRDRDSDGAEKLALAQGRAIWSSPRRPPCNGSFGFGCLSAAWLVYAPAADRLDLDGLSSTCTA